MFKLKLATLFSEIEQNEPQEQVVSQTTSPAFSMSSSSGFTKTTTYNTLLSLKKAWDHRRLSLITHFFLYEIHLNILILIIFNNFWYIFFVSNCLLMICSITWLRQMASFRLISIGFLKFVGHISILRFIKSCNFLKYSRDMRKYLKTCFDDSSATHRSQGIFFF